MGHVLHTTWPKNLFRQRGEKLNVLNKKPSWKLSKKELAKLEASIQLALEFYVKASFVVMDQKKKR